MKTNSITKPKRSKKNKKIKVIDPDGAANSRNEINLKPKSLQQEYSNKIQEIAQAKADLLDKKKAAKRNRNKFKNIDSESSDEPKFKRRKNESEEGFMRRVDREASAYIQKVKMEEKFNINEFKDMLNKKEKIDGRNKEGSRHAKKMMRLKEKKNKLKEKKLTEVADRVLGFESLKDKVEFGEVAMQPPSLKRYNSQNKNRNLLLSNMFQEASKKPMKLTADLSADRQLAIDFYRRMKSDKYVDHFKHGLFT